VLSNVQNCNRITSQTLPQEKVASSTVQKLFDDRLEKWKLTEQLPVRVLRIDASEKTMKPNESTEQLFKIEDKKKYEDNVTYIYAGSDPSAVHKPITVYKEKNTNVYLVAGRYVGFTETHLKYKPLSDEEQKLVVEKLGSGKLVKFLV